MLYPFTKLRSYTLGARDGNIGSVEDVYFDDERWTVRYFVVDTGNWLSGRRVLISPLAVSGAWHERAIPVNLTRAQVEKSPPVDTEQPVSRHYEMALSAYYGYPFYWHGPQRWGIATLPPLLAPEAAPPPPVADPEIKAMAEAEMAAAEKSHLRSGAEVTGYGIEATDGSIGHLDDFLIDNESWAIPQLIVDKRSWLPGGQVLVPPEAVARIDWHHRSVHLKLTRDEIRRCPDSP